MPLWHRVPSRPPKICLYLNLPCSRLTQFLDPYALHTADRMVAKCRSNDHTGSSSLPLMIAVTASIRVIGWSPNFSSCFAATR